MNFIHFKSLCFLLFYDLCIKINSSSANQIQSNNNNNDNDNVVVSHYESKLIKYLMDNYDAAVRPAHNFTQPLMVTFGLSLHHIVDVDEKNQILTTSCWLTQVWNDVHLHWNSTIFGGISVIRLPHTRVWRPDIILYNNADSQYSSAIINTNVIVSNSGEVTWLSHGIFKSSCDINVEYFPFDVQSCAMKWASWTYDGYQVDLQIQGEVGDTSNYHANGEFDLLTFEAIRNVKIYSCCEEPYPDITFTIVMKRRPMFYVFNLIIPCLLINGIALLVFFVPCESGEKVTLGISALLSMTVFLMTIRESLPPTEKTPLIGLYYGVSICIVCFASAMAVVTLNIHHRSVMGCPVPALLRFIVLGILSKIVRIQQDPTMLTISDDNANSGFSSCVLNKSYLVGSLSKLSGQQQQQPGFSNRTNSTTVHLDAEGASRKCHYLDFIQRSPRFNRIIPFSVEAANGRLNNEDINNITDEQSNSNSVFITKRLDLATARINEMLEKCDKRKENERKQEIAQNEWKQVARVVDRLLFWIFTILTLVATTLILFSSPHGPSITHLFNYT